MPRVDSGPHAAPRLQEQPLGPLARVALHARLAFDGRRGGADAQARRLVLEAPGAPVLSPPAGRLLERDGWRAERPPRPHPFNPRPRSASAHARTHAHRHATTTTHPTRARRQARSLAARGGRRRRRALAHPSRRLTCVLGCAAAAAVSTRALRRF
eukprot:2501691-Prymnesium_polylepis.1